MEVQFDFTGTLPEGVAKLDHALLTRLTPRKCWAVQWAIDHMGALSTQAQGLKRQLTSYDKIMDSDTEQTLFMLWEKHPTKENHSIVIGMLKVGKKRLFLLNQKQVQYEVNPVCVMDFYVHESKQRKGYGHVVFDAMMVEEVIQPYQIAIDRPSTPFLCFLTKYYELKDPVWQSTNFVVFPPFFDDHAPASNRNRSSFQVPMSEKQQHPQQGSRPNSRSSSLASPRHAYSSRDSASGIIHGTAPIPARQVYGSDTPTGRKNTRDFGHTSLW